MSTDVSLIDLLSLFDKQDPLVEEVSGKMKGQLLDKHSPILNGDLYGKTKMELDDFWINLESPKYDTDDSLKLGRQPAVDALESALRENGVDLTPDWELESDDFLSSILNGEKISGEDPSFSAPSVDDLLDVPRQVETSIPPSSASDSGVSSDYSSDQQLSPSCPEEEQPSPKLYTDGLSERSTQHSDQSDGDASPMLVDDEQTIVLDSASLGDFGEVKVEDNEAVISMDIVETPEMKQSSLLSLKNSASSSVIRVTPINSTVNPRSILLPVTLKDLKDVKAIKIINPGPVISAGSVKTFTTCLKPSGANCVMSQTVSRVTSGSSLSCGVASLPHTVGVAEGEHKDATKAEYPKIQLQDEEVRLLKKENLPLPTHYPLTKQEERDLKRIRRKIRNKVSAQDSRRRKKEYIDGLEDRVKKCTEANIQLQKRVNVLESQNRTLLSQLKRLQGLVTSGRVTQTSTCLMVLILSFALFLVPSLRPGQNRNQSGENQDGDLTMPDVKMPPVGGHSRSLLSKTAFTDLYKNDADLYIDSDKALVSKVQQALHNPLDDHDYEPPSKVSYIKEERKDIKDEYITPPVDDQWPAQALEDVYVIDSDTEERHVNVTDSEGTRTVVLQVPKDL